MAPEPVMRTLRILHIFTAWDARESDERGLTGLLRTLSAAGVESHLICAEARSEFPDYLASTKRLTGLRVGRGEGDWSRMLPDVVASIQPQAVCVHDDVHGHVTQQLNRIDRRYELWWWVNDHRMTCLTGLRARSEDRETMCMRPFSFSCFGEVESDRCIRKLPDRERLLLFTEYLTRLNLLLALPSVDCVIVQNEFMAEMVLINCINTAPRIRILPGVLPCVHRKTTSPRRDNLRTVLFRGALLPESGLHFTIQALAGVYADQPILFRIVGTGEDEKYTARCRTLADISLRKNSSLSIQFEHERAGSIDESPYRDAEVVVMPAQWSVHSTVPAARALRAGAAVVATGAGALGSLLRQTGLVVGGEPAEIAEGIWTLLIDEDLRQSVVRNGQRLVRKHFSAERQVREIHALLGNHAAAVLKPAVAAT
jgi:glycosyltransferase involved in cell wall biosynthesis